MQICQQSTRERRKRVKKNALKPNGSQIVYERQTYNKRVWKRQTEIKRGKKENANVKQISNGREKKNCNRQTEIKCGEKEPNGVRTEKNHHKFWAERVNGLRVNIK